MEIQRVCVCVFDISYTACIVTQNCIVCLVIDGRGQSLINILFTTERVCVTVTEKSRQKSGISWA